MKFLKVLFCNTFKKFLSSDLSAKHSKMLNLNRIKNVGVSIKAYRNILNLKDSDILQLFSSQMLQLTNSQSIVKWHIKYQAAVLPVHPV
ncbi:hypothetical protein Pse7429DRAFT_1151 [Pseudanabaena biceps PCC 7429]|uniref:Uncharacterized protein n=1 Tax=Pseudanabaena biceps PCC 7429 TaxID=927668 RepID=L8N6F6_9CYAN|nr:hypothetical protein Pse7429DRAFT_1151 [Pseudanabaena biceps PCC 7429]